MDYKEVLASARKTIGTKCKACPECNGLACGNALPGPGSKPPGNGAHDNWMAWRNIKLNMDTFTDSSAADCSGQLLGRQVSMPLITGPVGRLKDQYTVDGDVKDFNRAIAAACAREAILGSFGDGTDADVLPESIRFSSDCDHVSMPIFNPFSDAEIREKIDICRSYQPYAVGIVVDSAGLPHLKARNIEAGAKTVQQLRALKEYAKAPHFLIKGVMSAAAAEKALDAGADAIIVSNHGGRVLAETPATAEVLPEIAEAVQGRAQIIVDGGIRSGLDIFKALALGADGVMICRPFVVAYYGGSTEGIRCYIQKLRSELCDTMYMCGAKKISDINDIMIRRLK